MNFDWRAKEDKRVTTKNVMHTWNKLFVMCLVLLVVTTGCARPPRKGSEEATGGTSQTKPSNPLAIPVNPAFPGPYKTVLLNGVEYKQGRFPQGEFGGTLVEPLIASDPKTFNYWAADDATSSRLSGFMWSALVTTDPYDGQVIPDMASEFQMMPDHVTYITKLRKGLRWSDGQPVTADDVAFTFNTIVNQGLGNSSLKDVISVEGKPPTVTVVDPQTNKFVTAKPFVPFIRALSGVAIAPKHILEPMLSGKDARKKFAQLWSPSNADPKTFVTCGPFKLSRFVPSQRVEFERATNFYEVDPHGQPLPYINRLVFLFVPNVMTNLLKFKAGETDITQVRNRDAVDLMKDQQRLNFKLYNLGQDSSSYFLMFNLNRRKNDKGKPYVEPYKSAWFNDVNFRQAINHVLNRQQMIDGYLRGIGVPLFTCEPPSSVYFNKDLPAFQPDVDYALSLLKQSGFEKKPDGNLYDKDGHLVEFDMLAGAGGTMNGAIAGFMINDLKKLGMKVNYQEQEFNSLINKIDSTKDWQACIFSLTSDPLEPNNGANVWRSDGRLHLFDEREPNAAGKIVVTDARPWETQIDNLFNQGVQEFDSAKRAKIYHEYQKIVYDQAPFIYLVSAMDMIAARNTIENYQPTQLSQTAWGLHNLDEIYMSGTAKGGGKGTAGGTATSTATGAGGTASSSPAGINASPRGNAKTTNTTTTTATNTATPSGESNPSGEGSPPGESGSATSTSTSTATGSNAAGEKETPSGSDAAGGK